MIRILIVDDHRLVRAGFHKILSEERDIQVVGEAGNGKEALQFVQTYPVDLVLLDISMPGENGLEVLPKLKQLAPDLHVLMLSMHAGDHFAARAISAGADAYMTKESAAEELVGMIRRIFPDRN